MQQQSQYIATGTELYLTTNVIWVTEFPFYFYVSH
jgi:hypothetical protein